MRARDRRVMAVALVVGMATLVGAAMATAGVKNGGFEGSPDGWALAQKGSGTWGVSNTSPFASPAPEGTFAAYTEESGPSSKVLFQDVKLKPHMKHQLVFWVGYENGFNQFLTPNNLSEEGGKGKRGVNGENPNQQIRVDVMKPTAPLYSLKGTQVLKNVYRTEVGFPLEQDWVRVRANLSKFAGKTVRLRFAEVDNQGPQIAGFDDVKIKSS